MEGSSQSKKATYLAVLFAALLWFGLTVPRLHRPGLYYDEVIFVNAGLGGPLDTFAQTRVLGWPMFIMPYIGALKSLIHAPFFALFGVNLWTLRLPSLFLSFGTVLFLAGIAKRLAGRRAFYFALFFFVLDPALLWTSRADFGPTTLAGLFRAMSLWLFLTWIAGGGRLRYFLLTLSLCLGLWDKLNFIWFLGALVGGGLLVYPKQMALRFRERRAFYLMVNLMGLGVGLYFLIQRILPLLQLQQEWFGYPPGWERVQWLWGLLQETLDGRSIALFHFPRTNFSVGMVQWFLALLGGMFLFVLAVRKDPSQAFAEQEEIAGRFPRGSILLVVMFFLVGGQIFLTKQVGGLHHMMMMHPLPHLLGFALWGDLGGARSRVLCRIGRLILAGTALAWLFVSGRLDLQYLRALAHPEKQNPKWSSSIFDLSRRIEAKKWDYVLCADWGLHAPLFALATKKHRPQYWDLWPKFKELNKHPKDGKWLAGVMQGKHILVVVHAKGFVEQKPSRANALHWVAGLPGIKKHWMIKHGDGRLLFEVYEILPK